MKNNRHYKRYAIKCSGYIIDGAQHLYRFFVNNISASGMNIVTDREIKETRLLTIRFDSGGMLLPHAKQAKGIVVRKRLGKNDFTYSIRFLELTHEEIIELDEFLRYTHQNLLSTHLMPSEDSDKIYAE